MNTTKIMGIGTFVAVLVLLTFSFVQQKTTQPMYGLLKPTSIELDTSGFQKNIEIVLDDSTQIAVDRSPASIDPEAFEKVKTMDGKDFDRLMSQAEPSNLQSDISFYMKAGLSLIFCLAALFVILSNRYDEDTRKWAFSVLSLIAGVWIGDKVI